MDGSDVAEFTLFSERTPEQLESLLTDNLLNLAAVNDPDIRRIDNHWKYLIYGEKTNLNLQDTENNELPESGEELRSPKKIHSAVNMTDKKSIKSKTDMVSDPGTYDDDEVFEDNNSKDVSEVANNEQADKIEQIRQSVIISGKRKSSSEEKRDNKLDDSGLGLNDINETGSAKKTDSEVHDKQFHTFKNHSSNNEYSTDEDAPIFDNRSDKETTSMDNDKNHSSNNKYSTNEDAPIFNNRSDKETTSMDNDKMVKNHRGKHSASKRKVSLPGTEDEESVESGEPLNKRSRGGYKLRSLTKKKLTYTDDRPISQKPGPSSSKKIKNRTPKYQYDSKDSDSEIDVDGETGDEKFVDKNNLLSKKQSAHNRKILKTLNEGSVEQLKTLSRIGPKTAKMIYQYRKLHGKLVSVGDLKNMPGWSPKMFERFQFENNIDLD